MSRHRMSNAVMNFRKNIFKKQKKDFFSCRSEDCMLYLCRALSSFYSDMIGGKIYEPIVSSISSQLQSKI
jgi:hypothetical protein